MKTVYRHIILITCAVLWVIAGCWRGVYAEEVPVTGSAVETAPAAVMDADETLLFNLINSARRDPLGMAASLGMNRNQILANLPEYQEILLDGLPTLKFNQRLFETATGHADDMMMNSYYAYESLDGRSIAQRMSDAGYAAYNVGESLSLVVFNNFIASENAATQIFEKIFKNELDPAFEGQRNILNPRLKEMGVALRGGIFRFDGYAANAYVVVCDFGTEVPLQDLQVMQLINQLRAYPVTVARFYKKDMDTFFELFPEYLEPMTNGYPALSFSRPLYHAAAGHAAEMAENEYVGWISLDGRRPPERLRENGYEPAWMKETVFRMPINTDTEEGEDPVIELDVPGIFQRIISRAFRTQDWWDRKLFSEEAADIGLSLVYQSSAIGSISTNDFQLVVIDYATTGEANPSGITGTVYDDVNGNGLYDVGEGVADAMVMIEQNGMKIAIGNIEKNNLEKNNPNSYSAVQVKTNIAGGFSADLTPGSYRVQVQVNETIRYTGDVEVESFRKWIGLTLDPKAKT